ncbi:hypothetical protein BH20ACI1_BH20ACI1_13980 [soil metagenome]
MKKCPICDKTFDDGMRFCQTDGTPLVEVADDANKDPYKTTAASQDEMASAIPLDPFKTMVAPSSKKKEEEILEMPEEPDFLKTMVSPSQSDKKSNLPKEEKEEIKNISPPSPFDDAVKPESPGDKFSFDSESSAANDALPQTDSGYSPIDENPSSPRIPSPFDESMIGFQAPSKPMPPFDEPEPLPVGGNDPFQMPSPIEIAEIKAEALNTPFAEQVEQQQNQPMEQANWTPPPAPDANWQNQQIGQNTPFQTPPAGQGQNQTLAIVSLVLGILSIPCCGFILFGIGALVTGFMAKGKADQNPDEYGGRGLALGGMILGGITIVIGIILNIFYLFVGLPMNF